MKVTYKLVAIYILVVAIAFALGVLRQVTYTYPGSFTAVSSSITPNDGSAGPHASSYSQPEPARPIRPIRIMWTLFGSVLLIGTGLLAVIELIVVVALPRLGVASSTFTRQVRHLFLGLVILATSIAVFIAASDPLQGINF